MIGERYEQRTRLAVLKVRVGTGFRVSLLRGEPLGHIVHWLGKGSFLCPGVRCPACLASTGARWVGLMPCRLHGADGSRRTVLVEFSGDAWARLAGLLRFEGVDCGVGVEVELSRKSMRGGLIAEGVLCGEAEKVRPLADWVLVDALATLYGLPRCLEGWGPEEWTERVREVVVGKLERALQACGSEFA